MVSDCKFKLSEFDSTIDFIEELIERSTNPCQIKALISDGDYDRIQKAMQIALELNEIANESNISLWICSYKGIPQVSVSMGAYIANMAMMFEDGDWERIPLEDI